MKRSRKQNNKQPANTELQNFDIKNIQPKTTTQNIVFKHFSSNHLFLHGAAGTGKTFLSLYLSLKALQKEEYSRIVIVRSAVPSRDIGFMPGTASEKMGYYETPYKDIVNDLYGRGDAYEILKRKHQLAFMPTSFIRGLTIDNAIILVDEAQNLNSQELNSIATRVGEGSKLIICGDTDQDDLTSKRYHEESGLNQAIKLFKRIESVKFIEFTMDDCVRSGFVKEYLFAKANSSRKNEESISSLPAFITEKPKLLTC